MYFKFYSHACMFGCCIWQQIGLYPARCWLWIVEYDKLHWTVADVIRHACN